MSKEHFKKLLEHRWDDLRHIMDHPVEYEVFEERYLYVTRYGIKSKDSFSLGKTLLFTPDVDAVSVLQLSSEDSNLFSRLLGAGIKSRLIQHFSECEGRGEAYTDPETGLILWKRVPVLTAQPPSVTQKNSVMHPPKMLYTLGGGFDYFHRLICLDKDFLHGLCEGFSQGLCDPYRIDLCVDLSYDIMGHVSESVSKGHYESSNRHPYGYGWLGGKRIEAFVGKNSALFKRFAKEQLRLDSIYFGGQKRSNYIIVFYDKEVERKERGKARWPNKSRIEIRIFARDSTSKKQMLDVLKTYISDAPGWETRTLIFSDILYSNVKFTVNKRNRNKHLNPIAPWWRSFLGTLIHPIVKQKRLKDSWVIPNLLLSGNAEESREDFFSLLSTESVLLDRPLLLGAEISRLPDSEEKRGDTSCIKKKTKNVKISHFDRILQKVLGFLKKEESTSTQFRDFYRKYSINKYLSKKQIGEIKSHFELTVKKVNKSK